MATVRVKWTDSITPDVTNHKIYRDDILLATVGLGVGVAGYDDTTAVEGATYKYEVQAVNPTGESTDENTDAGGNVKTIEVIVATYQLMLTDDANHNRLVFDVAERLVLPFATSWSMEWTGIYTGDLADASKFLAYGYDGTLHHSFITDALGQVNLKQGTLKPRWIYSRLSTPSGIRLDAMNDGTLHTWRIAWTFGDPCPELIIDGEDFGNQSSVITPMTSDITIHQIHGNTSTITSAWDFRSVKFTINGVVEEFIPTAGSGDTITGSNGTILKLATSNAGGQTYIDSTMWEQI